MTEHGHRTGMTPEDLAQSMMTGPMPAARLARRYDADRLREEMEVLGLRRFNVQRSFDHGRVGETVTEDWRVLPLRSIGGDPTRTDPGGPGLTDYEATPYSHEAPYLTAILEGLPARLRAARLMALAPGAEVDEHRDTPYGLAAGWFRLHVPIVTNPGAVLVIDGTEQCWQPGTLWYGDFGRLHAVANHGDTTRVHLVVDCAITPELLDLFPDEFVSRVRWAETLLDRPEVPTGQEELEAMACDVMVPAAFLPTYAYLLPAPDGAADVPGRLRVLGQRLVLEIGDGTEIALVHVGEGEFRPLCWTMERTVKIDLLGKDPVVRYRLRCGSGFAEHVRVGAAVMSGTPAA